MGPLPIVGPETDCCSMSPWGLLARWPWVGRGGVVVVNPNESRQSMGAKWVTAAGTIYILYGIVNIFLFNTGFP